MQHLSLPKYFLLGKIGNPGKICPKILQHYMSRFFLDVLAWWGTINMQKLYHDNLPPKNLF